MNLKHFFGIIGSRYTAPYYGLYLSAGTTTFTNTVQGGISYRIPSGITSLSITVCKGGGAGGKNTVGGYGASTGGAGGSCTGTLAVSAGQDYIICIGGGLMVALHAQVVAGPGLVPQRRPGPARGPILAPAWMCWRRAGFLCC